jgi:hypothetical protein
MITPPPILVRIETACGCVRYVTTDGPRSLWDQETVEVPLLSNKIPGIYTTEAPPIYAPRIHSRRFQFYGHEYTKQGNTIRVFKEVVE